MHLTWLPQDEDAFPPVATALCHPNGLLAAGGDLRVSRLLAGYRCGIFPWYGPGEPILWWSPDPRCVFHTERLRAQGRLARWLRGQDWEIRADTCFAEVVAACAQPRRGQDGTWITDEMREAYVRLHQAGYAHSVEVHAGGRLVGGLYGVALGRMFFAESMFSRCSNASKAALLALAHQLRAWQWPWIDAQVASEHLLRLGASLCPRDAFVARLQALVNEPGRPGSWAPALRCHVRELGRGVA